MLCRNLRIVADRCFLPNQEIRPAKSHDTYRAQLDKLHNLPFRRFNTDLFLDKVFCIRKRHGDFFVTVYFVALSLKYFRTAAGCGSEEADYLFFLIYPLNKQNVSLFSYSSDCVCAATRSAVL